ncbi:uncharacterized protein F5891DRAFT_669315 [Suillus fuscotomentosus]|uniref:Uncharacterized protein n=1 Tax=Suillus fuscotomentosus TaxID=1912939 RepID=A0AAD4DWK9_9AGAM|nr:uncharacterized protein F5891DRAFT_669315 [Suillus fuscotomentosus]KAG1895493.1 hypothetical protein F5891DRAFT_669315 [Suillus fuscotomentosus]
MTSLQGVLGRLLSIIRSGWTRLSEVFRGPVHAVVNSEAQPLGQDLDVLAENNNILNLDLPDIPTSDLEAPSVKWLLETSTDPEVFLAAARLVPQVEWPLDVDVSDMLHQLFDILRSCVDIQGYIIPSLKEKASACAMALIHLYYGCVLQAYPDDGDFIVHGRPDFDVLLDIFPGMYTADRTVCSTTMNFCQPDGNTWHISWSEVCPDSVPEWLSHVLPYHFVTGRVNEDIENLAIKVMSKLLSSPSPSSLSDQILANCIILACVMVGAQVDKKAIVRIDKSSALPLLSESLLVQFQKALWAWDGGELDNDRTGVVRRTWKLLDIICRIVELARYSYRPLFHTMRNLDVCKKIYSRARSSEQNDASALLAALRNALHFTLAAASISRDPAQVWNRLFGEALSYSPEDIDWIVDYFDFIYYDDHEAAYDVLLLLGSMGVCCSPAKQHLFIERLIACMDSNMPLHLRHAALRAAHSAQEQIASIDAIDDARLRDTVLTKLSPAILSVLCPHPVTTPTNDDLNLFSNYDRDLCYLELVCALARNPDWHPHLSGDCHIDRCISMIPRYCNSESPTQHAFYIACILLQIIPEQTSITTLDSVAKQQWRDVMRSAWDDPPYTINNACCFKPLLVLVDGTKKYMQIASKSDLDQLIRNVDEFVETLERNMQEEMGLEIQDSEQVEGIIIAAKELRTAASKMLERFGR